MEAMTADDKMWDDTEDGDLTWVLKWPEGPPDDRDKEWKSGIA